MRWGPLADPRLHLAAMAALLVLGLANPMTSESMEAVERRAFAAMDRIGAGAGRVLGMSGFDDPGARTELSPHYPDYEGLRDRLTFAGD